MIYENAAVFEGKDVSVTMVDGVEFTGHLTEVIFETDPDEFEEECLLLYKLGGYVELKLSRISAISEL